MSPKNPKLESQTLPRHFNEALILSSLANGAKHGYQLALDIEERSDGRFGFKHGTLYPILHKLEKDGLIEGAWSTEGQRGRRKQYQLTSDGRRYLKGLLAEWHDLMGQFFRLVEGEGT